MLEQLFKNRWWEKPLTFPWDVFFQLDEFFSTVSYCIEIEVPSSVFLENREQISIGKGTILEPGVYIRGPCCIGKNCTLRHGAYIRGDTILRDGAHVGHAAEVKRSILLENAAASHFCYVGDSILGAGVNLGAGVKCANLRLDRKEVMIHFEGNRWNTGLHKLGAILGDGVQVGCNAVLNPGTIIFPRKAIAPLSSVRGIVRESL